MRFIHSRLRGKRALEPVSPCKYNAMNNEQEFRVQHAVELGMEAAIVLYYLYENPNAYSYEIKRDLKYMKDPFKVIAKMEKLGFVGQVVSGDHHTFSLTITALEYFSR